MDGLRYATCLLGTRACKLSIYPEDYLSKECKFDTVADYLSIGGSFMQKSPVCISSRDVAEKRLDLKHTVPGYN